MLGAAAHELVMSGGEVWKVRRQAPGETPIAACRWWRSVAPVPKPTRSAMRLPGDSLLSSS